MSALPMLQRAQRPCALACGGGGGGLPLHRARAAAPSLPLRRSVCSRRPAAAPLRVEAKHKAAAAAAATVLPASSGFSWLKSTGVPLLQVLQTLSLQEAAARAALLILASTLSCMLANKLLDAVGRHLEARSADAAREGMAGPGGGLRLVLSTAAAAVHRPGRMLAPIYSLFYSLLVASAFTEVAVSRLEPHVSPALHVLACTGLQLLGLVTQVMQDFSEGVLIVFIAWFALAWKDELLAAVMAGLEGGGDGGDEASLARVLVPLSNLLTWAIVVAAVLANAANFGVNLQPILAFGSISTVAVGFAAQSTMANVVSALQIYSSRPFIVGDRIELRTLGGSVIVSGVVEAIAPMRTTIRADNKLPISINNKDVMNFIVVNESKMRRTTVQAKLPLVQMALTIRYQDVDLIADIERSITDYLASHPLVDAAISPRCVLDEFTPQGPRLAIRALLQRGVASRQASVRAEMLRESERIMRSHGAFLAIEDQEQWLPPCPPSPPTDSAASSGEFGSLAQGA